MVNYTIYIVNYIIFDIQDFKFNFQVSTMFKRRDFNGNRKTEVARGNNKAPTFQEFVLNQTKFFRIFFFRINHFLIKI